MAAMTAGELSSVNELIERYGAQNMEPSIRPLGRGFQIGFRCWIDDEHYRTRHAFSRYNTTPEVVALVYTEIEQHLNYVLDHPSEVLPSIT